jgi:hypothetical protein
MAKKQKNELERIVNSSPTYDRIGVGQVSEALGAQHERGTRRRPASPFSLWALRSRLLSDVVSTGGRPGRKEAVTRKKIPMTETEWHLLDEITRIPNIRGVKATSGQVAGILLNQSMTEVLKRLDRVAPAKVTGSGPTLQPSESELEERVESILAAAASAQSHLQELRPIALELLRRMSEEKATVSDDE